MKTIAIDLAGVNDWNSFHRLFAREMGFPAFYGRNMDAWIDCMTDVDDPEAGMTSAHVGGGEVLVLNLKAAGELKKRCPKILEALVECSAFVNLRRIEAGKPAILALAFSV